MTEVSVIIPTHNRSRLLELTLKSVLWQRNVDFETIVVDDGSTDDTPRLLRSLGDRIRVIRHEQPRGVSAARNHGIAVARGEWVAFLDDDDLWAPDKLELQLAAVRRDGRCWAYAGVVAITIDNRILSGTPPARPERVVAEMMMRNHLSAGSSNVIVSRARLPAPPIFDASLYHHADWDLWIRLARLGPPAYVSKPLVGYRFHPASASLDLEGMFAEANEIERRYGGPVDRSGFNRYLAILAKRAGWGRTALRYYSRAAMGNQRYALREFLPDVWTLCADVLRSRANRAGVTFRARSRGHDPLTPWKAEARLWVDRLLTESADIGA
jgi:glycosyltransferase involved in cell wall biosynthesis